MRDRIWRFLSMVGDWLDGAVPDAYSEMRGECRLALLQRMDEQAEAARKAVERTE